MSSFKDKEYQYRIICVGIPYSSEEVVFFYKPFDNYSCAIRDTGVVYYGNDYEEFCYLLAKYVTNLITNVREDSFYFYVLVNNKFFKFPCFGEYLPDSELYKVVDKIKPEKTQENLISMGDSYPNNYLRKALLNKLDKVDFREAEYLLFKKAIDNYKWISGKSDYRAIVKEYNEDLSSYPV